LDAAIACYRRTLELQPDFAVAHINLGNALRAQGNLDEAAIRLRRASQLQPDLADAHINLGAVLHEQRKLNEATACYRRGLELKPDHAATYNNLGNIFKEQGKLDDAVACYGRALELKPDYAAAHNNLGSTFKDQGKLDEAIACYDRALELRPDFAEAHSNRLYTLHFCSDYDAQTIYAEHRRWNLQFAEPLAKCALPHSNERSVDRRLRIGYVSPDLCDHVVGRFLLPLLETHDRERYEIYCYASVRHSDAMTQRCRAQADVWRNVPGYADEQLAESIRQDQIDVLVDLTMHMAESRLLAFARKPAPVQVAYLAYAGTTGLSVMDYRLTDPYLDPPAQNEPIYSEESICLPETYWCYRPPIETPAVNDLPALRVGHITFGCLNNFCKVTDQTLAIWASLLQAMPLARLLLHAHPGNHRDRVRSFLAQRRISPDRLTFADMVPLEEYYRQYHRIDVALDPFPYGGGTTTCDALWMGVPVVSLAGQTAVGRGGLSILSNVGLADWVAYDGEQYVRIATELGGDVERLRELRATLRDRMRGSPLMDAPRFARNVEAAYRAMWQRWCERRG
jgi:predicted O-linked N-acetylglucosamine transferase (SPINDLY family)